MVPFAKKQTEVSLLAIGHPTSEAKEHTDKAGERSSAVRGAHSLFSFHMCWKRRSALCGRTVKLQQQCFCTRTPDWPSTCALCSSLGDLSLSRVLSRHDHFRPLFLLLPVPPDEQSEWRLCRGFVKTPLKVFSRSLVRPLGPAVEKAGRFMDIFQPVLGCGY